MTVDDLYVRVARAEMERDQAREERDRAKESAGQAWQAHHAMISGDRNLMLKTLHILGIPARDLADMYQIEQIWMKERGSESLLAWARERGFVPRLETNEDGQAT